jgi:hypothetical protein
LFYSNVKPWQQGLILYQKGYKITNGVIFEERKKEQKKMWLSSGMPEHPCIFLYRKGQSIFQSSRAKYSN